MNDDLQWELGRLRSMRRFADGDRVVMDEAPSDKYDSRLQRHLEASRLRRLRPTLSERDRRALSEERGPEQVEPGDDVGGQWEALATSVLDPLIQGGRMLKGEIPLDPDKVTDAYLSTMLGSSVVPVESGALRVAGGAGKKATQRANAPASVSKIFDDIHDPGEAMQLAISGGHLKVDSAGRYIGLGDHIDSPQALGALRRRVDQLVSDGSWNADWYLRQKDLARSLSDEDYMQSLFARGTAAYSPQAMPKVELPTFINQHNAKMLTGEDTIPRTGSQSRNVANAYGPPLEPGDTRYDIDPGAIRLGKKTGPYANKKDPTVDGGYKTASDVWHARSFELNDPNNIGAAGHGVLTGENLLLGDRANAAGIPVGSQPAGTLHDASTAQAATWGAERLASMRAADAARFAKQTKAREVYERDPERWRKRNKDKSPPAKPKPVRSEAELRAYGSTGLDTALPDQLAYISKEAVTGADLGHGALPGTTMAEMPDAWKADYTARHKEAVGRDPLIESLQLYSKKPVDTVGEWTPKGGVTEYNPGWADPVLVSNEKTKMGRGTPEVERGALALAAQLEGYLGAQQGVGVNRLINRGAGNTRLRDTNALRVDLRGRTDPELTSMRDFARANNLNEINLGDNSAFVRFGDEGPVPGIGGEVRKLAAKDPRMGPFQYGTSRLESNFVDSGHVPQEGTGVATDALLKAFDESGIPNVYDRVDAGRLPQIAALRNAIDEEMLKSKGLPVRADLMKARELLRGGLSALKAYVAKHGSKGLPAVLLPVLDMTPSPERRE